MNTLHFILMILNLFSQWNGIVLKPSDVKRLSFPHPECLMVNLWTMSSHSRLSFCQYLKKWPLELFLTILLNPDANIHDSFTVMSRWVEPDICNLLLIWISSFVPRSLSRQKSERKKTQQLFLWGRMWMKMPLGGDAAGSFVLGPFCSPSGACHPRALQWTWNWMFKLLLWRAGVLVLNVACSLQVHSHSCTLDNQF